MLVVHHDGKSHDYNIYDQYINLEDLYAEINLLGE
ncbi:ABC transporter ATP-binding protein [Candidatus Rickettsia colombianensi]|nr:ABC transporter ATP-binding protein [Candidatus Rickettsia colombianensi]